MKFGWGLVLVCVGLGCGPKVEADDSGDEGGTEPTSGGGSTSGVTVSGGTRPSTTAMDSGSFDSGEVGEVDEGIIFDHHVDVCPQSPAFTCAEGIDCVSFDVCGSPFSPFDEWGCLRDRCPCVDGEICFTPAHLGGCASSDLSCAEGPSGCECGGSDDCGGSYCVPEDAIPPIPCVGMESEEACTDANCTWLPGVTAYEVDGFACDCDDPPGVCVQPIDYEGLPGPAAYYRVDDPSRGHLLDFIYNPTPLGLQLCDGFGPVPVCECAAVGC